MNSQLHFLKPRITEKSYGLANQQVYTVDVPKNLNKITIKQIIERDYSVDVLSVNTLNISGKAKRTISKKGRRVAKGKSNDYKKAYVILKSGQSLPFFEEVEEEQAKEAKIVKEVEKQASKVEAKATSKRRLPTLRRANKAPSQTRSNLGGGK